MSQGSSFLTSFKIFIGYVRAQTKFYIDVLIYVTARNERKEHFLHRKKSNFEVEITNQTNYDVQEQIYV